jgi:hypothetical protein
MADQHRMPTRHPRIIGTRRISLERRFSDKMASAPGMMEGGADVRRPAEVRGC